MNDRLADLTLTIDDVALDQRSRATSSGFTRVSTIVTLTGEDCRGRGEDVTYEAADHEALPDTLPLAGEYTFAEYSAALDDLDLPRPSEARFLDYRRWALESAGLDLALRQQETDLGSVLGRAYDPVEFVVSTRVESFDRIQEILAVAPDATFKLDPTPEWDDALVTRLARMGRVRTLDLKGLYEGTDVDTEADPAFYERVVEAFPDAVIEDPKLTEETRPVFDGHEGRVAWDVPIHGVEDIEALPFAPSWINIKPSRFGTVESLLDTIAYCEREGITMYGGGQFELGVGREHIQTLASLFYPGAPNDVAPGGYNSAELDPDLPGSPLEPAPDRRGLSFAAE
ncbi:hypothetical protein [Natronomonas sp. EA1]|uniref:hypothetical protein n=1 Tax=Natronomonas sp. EA1 TaxID=3421655 RepID=UPI003EB741D9